MTSPIATPVRASSLSLFRVLDSSGECVAIASTPEQRDELIRRINGWDGLVEASQHAEQALALLTSYRATSFDKESYARDVRRGVLAHEKVVSAMSDAEAAPLRHLIPVTLTAAQSVPSVSEGV